MSGFDEVLGLTAETVRLWRRHGWALGAWFCLGFAVHTAGLLASAALGATHPVLATVVFVLGVVATLVALVLMIHTVQPSLRAPAALDPDPGSLARRRIPRGVVIREGRLEVVTAAVGPFLAVYAVWGFVDEQVSELFGTNYRLLGLDPPRFSISFDHARLRFYLVLAVVVWLSRQGLALVERRRPLRPLRLLGVLAEALWVVGVFALVVIVARSVRDWLRGRVAYAVLDEGWQRLVAALPRWPLPFGLTLPKALDRVVAEVTGTVLPGAWHAVVLPLVWLALTATVLGWRTLGSGELLTSRLSGRLAGGPARRRLAEARRSKALAALLTSDLRTKYLPVLEALQLVARTGPAFVGAYLLLATLGTSLQACFDIAVTVVLGPRSAAASLATDPTAALVSGLLVTPVSIALYAAGFDRALAVVGGVELAGPRLRTSPRERPRPTTAATGPATRTPPG